MHQHTLITPLLLLEADVTFASVKHLTLSGMAEMGRKRETAKKKGRQTEMKSTVIGILGLCLSRNGRIISSWARRGLYEIY